MVSAGLFKASSIRVAEAAKILENTQREVNIALMNQMMALFDKMGIRSTEIIATRIAAARFKIAIGTGCTNYNANRVARSDIDKGGNSGPCPGPLAAPVANPPYAPRAMIVICETPAGTVYEPDVAVVVNVTVVAKALTAEVARTINNQKT